MTDHQFYTLVGEAKEYPDRDAFVSDAALSPAFSDSEPQDEIIEMLRKLWDAVHVPFSEIRKSLGLTQAAMAERICAPKRTIENWECRDNCPLPIRVMIFRLWLGL